jgi:peptide/nickel transport system permease protein
MLNKSLEQPEKITQNLPPTATMQGDETKSDRSYLVSGILRFLKDPLSVIALIIFSLIAGLCFLADFVSARILKFGRDDIDLTLLQKGLLPPVGPGVGGHILGTDELGRDLLVRLLYGGQVSLSIGLLVALIALVVGGTLGLLAGYFGGIVDDLVNLAIQFVLNIPVIFFLISLSLYFKPDVLSLSLTLGLISWVGLARQVRGSVLSLRNRDFVLAARATGAGNFRILTRHLLPNLISLILVVAGFDVAGAILVESALSYLGFGISVPIPSWGNMLSGAQNYFTSAPWLVFVPTLAIFTTVLCIFLIADGLRDAFDPRL